MSRSCARTGAGGGGRGRGARCRKGQTSKCPPSLESGALGFPPTKEVGTPKRHFTRACDSHGAVRVGVACSESSDVLMLNRDDILSDKINRKLRNLNQRRRSSVVSGMKVPAFADSLPTRCAPYFMACRTRVRLPDPDIRNCGWRTCHILSATAASTGDPAWGWWAPLMTTSSWRRTYTSACRRERPWSSHSTGARTSDPSMRG